MARAKILAFFEQTDTKTYQNMPKDEVPSDDKECKKALTELLFGTIESKNQSDLQLLLNLRVSPNEPDPHCSDYEDTPVFFAVRKNPDALPLLAQAGANVNATNEAGQTPLIAAVACNNLNAVKMLCTAGANVNAWQRERDTETKIATALMLACDLSKTPEIVDTLCTNGADVNAANFAGITALMIAAFKGNLQTVTTLCKYKANVNAAPDIKDISVLQHCLRNDKLPPALKEDILLQLLKNGANIQPANIGDVKALLSKSKDKVTTALMQACRDGTTPKIVQALLDNGAEVNATDGNGLSASQHCLKSEISLNDKKDVLLHLLKKGADIQPADIGDVKALLANSEEKVNFVNINGKFRAANEDNRIYLRDSTECLISRRQDKASSVSVTK